MFEQIANAFEHKASLTVTERLDEYRLVFEAADLDPKVALEQAEQLLTLTKKLPSRDRFELQVDFQGDSLSLTNTSEAARSALASLLQAHEDCGDARYALIVKKGGDGVLSIYCLSAFGRYLETDELENVLTALSNRFRDSIAFECLCPVDACGSDTLRFRPEGQMDLSGATNPSFRAQVLTSFRDNSYSAGIGIDLLPSDFHLVHRTGVDAVDNFMDKACAVLCAIYLANGSQIHRNKTLSYKLIGYKSMEGQVNFVELVPALLGLYKIYEWAYGVGGSSDRIGLARNVVSLQVDKLQDIRDNSNLWNAIYSNYQIYLKGNIVSYLSVKNKITEFLIESTAKTHALVEDLISSLKNGVFVMLTFMLSVVLVGGLKGGGTDIIFSLTYFWVVVVLCTSLTAWMVGTCRATIRRFDNLALTTENILRLGYSRILLDGEISDSIDPINARNRTYLVRQCWRYTFYWLLIAILFIGGFWGGVSANVESNLRTVETSSRLTHAVLNEGSFFSRSQLDLGCAFGASLGAFGSYSFTGWNQPGEVPFSFSRAKVHRGIRCKPYWIFDK